MMVNKDLLSRKLARLAQYLAELRPLAAHSLEEYQKNILVKRTAERLLLLIVEVASDINAHLIAKLTNKPASSYFDSFIQLSELKIVSDEFARDLARSAGLRNRLIHEYEEIDDELVYHSIIEALKSYRKYMKAIQDFMDQLELKKPKEEIET